MKEIDEVWSWPSTIAAALAGALYALYVWQIHIRRPSANGRALWAQIGVDALVGSFVFTVSQAVASIYIGDAGYVRIMSRYGLWIVFSAALAAGVWLGVRHRHRHGGHDT